MPRGYWESVQDQLQARAQICCIKRSGKQVQDRNPFAGLLYWEGARLSPDHTTKSGKRYRYYVAAPNGEHSQANIRLKAEDVEAVIGSTLSNWLLSSEKIVNDIIEPGTNANDIRSIKEAAYSLSMDVGVLNGQIFMVQFPKSLIKVNLDHQNITITINPQKLFDQHQHESSIKDEVMISSPCNLTRRGHETRLLLGECAANGQPDQTIIKNLVLAHRLKSIRFGEGNQYWSEVLKEQSIDPSISHRFLRFAFLVPDIVEAFLDGSAPIEVNAQSLKTLVDLPPCWDEQRRIFGIAS